MKINNYFACAWFALKIRAFIHLSRGELTPFSLALALAFARAEPAALAAGRPRAPLCVAHYSWLEVENEKTLLSISCI